MTRRNAVILALLFVILVVEILIVAPKELGTSVADDMKAAKAAALSEANRKGGPDKNLSGQVMHGVHSYGAKGQVQEWELWADKAVRPRENAKWTAQKVKVNFFADNGVMYTVTGERGQIDPEKKDIKIDGNVVTHSSNGYVFKTQSVDYNSSARRLVSPGAVEMIGPRDKNGGDIHLDGGALDADFGTNEINITHNVRANRKVLVGSEKQEKTAHISAQRALFSGRSNMAQFFGDVVIDVEAMQISGPRAKFAYDPKSQTLDAMKMDGGVHLTDSDKFATSGSVDLSLKDDRVVFSGSPRVVQNGDELVGDQIIMTDGGKKVEVSNARAQLEPQTSERANDRTKDQSK
jgi:LPS export ABC transporter protein LptC